MYGAAASTPSKPSKRAAASSNSVKPSVPPDAVAEVDTYSVFEAASSRREVSAPEAD
jgi:hypothetical protein